MVASQAGSSRSRPSCTYVRDCPIRATSSDVTMPAGRTPRRVCNAPQKNMNACGCPHHNIGDTPPLQSGGSRNQMANAVPKCCVLPAVAVPVTAPNETSREAKLRKTVLACDGCGSLVKAWWKASEKGALMSICRTAAAVTCTCKFASPDTV